jgi:hypothetical protein
VKTSRPRRPTPPARLLISACLSLAPALLCAATGSAPAAKTTIGVTAPQAQPADGGAQLSESLRQSLMGNLGGPDREVVILEATTPEQIDAEARGKHCSYILYTRIER